MSSSNIEQAQQASGPVVPQPEQQPTVDEPTEEPKPRLLCGLAYPTIFKLSIILLLITGIALGLTVGDLDSRIGDLLEWLDDNRLEGIAIFVAIYTLLTSVFFPSSLLTLAGGAIYGFAGIAIVWISACLGQSISFFLSRYLLYDIVKGWASKYKVWKGVDGAIKTHAVKITILVRLATLIPYSAANALLPITSMNFTQYTIGSAVGILPGVALFVTIGHLASGIAEVSSGDMDTSPTVLFVTAGVSVVVLVILVVLLTKYAKKALAEQLEADQAAEAAAAGAANKSEGAANEAVAAEETGPQVVSATTASSSNGSKKELEVVSKPDAVASEISVQSEQPSANGSVVVPLAGTEEISR